MVADTAPPPLSNSLDPPLKAGCISEHINNWKGLTSDKWVLKTVRGSHIEIEDLDLVRPSALSGETLLKPHRKNFVSNRNQKIIRKKCFKTCQRS